MADIVSILKTEIDTDPLVRGYGAMTDQQVLDDLNTVYRTRNRATMPATEVLNAIDKTEFNAKTAEQQQQIWDVLHIGEINPFGLEAALFTDIFGGSTTITALQAARKEDISRAEELGLGRLGLGLIAEARK